MSGIRPWTILAKNSARASEWVRLLAVVAVTVLLAVLPATGQGSSADAGGSAPAAGHAVRHPSKGRLYARLFLYTDEHAFLQDWAHRSRGLHFKNVSTLARGVQLTAVVAFANCEPDAKGDCNAKVDFTVLKPDGTVYAHLQDLNLWEGKKAPPRHALELSIDNLHIRIDPADPLGKYTVKARVRDLNSGKRVTVSKAFTAIAGTPAAAPEPKAN